MWNNSYRTPTERWQKTSDFPKGKKLPTYMGRVKEKKRKTETKEYGWDLHLWEGAVKEEKFPHTRKPLHRQRRGWAGVEASEPQRKAHQVCKGQSGEIPAQRSVPTSTHETERLVCSPAGAGGGWELRLRLRRSDPRERTGVGCVNTV